MAVRLRYLPRGVGAPMTTPNPTSNSDILAGELAVLLSQVFTSSPQVLTVTSYMARALGIRKSAEILAAALRINADEVAKSAVRLERVLVDEEEKGKEVDGEVEKILAGALEKFEKEEKQEKKEE